jgi:hypothetical protein
MQLFIHLRKRHIKRVLFSIEIERGDALWRFQKELIKKLML